MKGEKIFIAYDKTMRKKIYGFASEESASRFFFQCLCLRCDTDIALGAKSSAEMRL